MSTEIEFAKTIEIIATDLGVAAERIFEIFVSAQVMIGIIDVVSAIAMFGIAYATWKYSRKLCVIEFKDEDGEWKLEYDDIRATVYPVIAAIIAVMITCAFADCISGGLLKIAYPEYTAMKEILNLVT